MEILTQTYISKSENLELGVRIEKLGLTKSIPNTMGPFQIQKNSRNGSVKLNDRSATNISKAYNYESIGKDSIPNQNPHKMMETGDALAQESFAQRTGTIYVLKLDTSKFYFNASKVH